MQDGGTVQGEARMRHLRRRVYEIMEGGNAEDRASHLFDVVLLTLIMLNVVAFIAETVPRLAAAYGPYFHAFEMFSVGAFTVEYLLRLWASVEVPFLSRLPPWQARLSFARRGAQVIDLLAILPFYLAQFMSLDLRALRALRLLRFLKLTRYSPAMYSLMRVVSNERRSLAGAGLLLIAAVLFAATGMYFIEGETQPDKFGSVPDAAWWAIATLTTVGYGDVTPVTPLGKLFGSLVMVTGLCILALPVAIISAGFAQELSRRDFVVTWSLMAKIPMLAALDAREIGAIMPLLHAHNLPPNVEVMAEADAMFFVASGKVRHHKGADDAPSEFGSGEVLGISAMLDHGPHQGALVTASKCRLLKLHRSDFHRLETANPAIARLLREKAKK
jgi:voltage-gated potassium channel